MLTTEERRKLRDDKVFEELSKQPKPKKEKPGRKRGARPADAKMPPASTAAEANDRSKKK